SGGVVELRTRPVGAQAARIAESTIAEETVAVERALRAGRVAEARLRVEELARQFPSMGPVTLLRGRVLERAGLEDEAREAYETAVRQDPLLAPAYYHLGMVATRAGDFRRAEESFTTYARLPDARARETERASRAARLV